MSRLEANLLSRIESNPSVQERAILCSRLAIYYFHKGDAERAGRLVNDVREWLRFSGGLDVMVYINLAEATDLFQSAQTLGAIQKAKRAYALSSASGKPGLVALSSAWLAHLEFNSYHYVNAVEMIGISIKNLQESEPVAKTRCYMLLADMLSFCGKANEATSWYAKARAAAVDEGDEIAIGQIIYNSATFRFNTIRLMHVRGVAIDEELRLIELMIGSSSHYDVGVNSSAFESLLPMLNAQLLMLRRDYKNSTRIFSLWLHSADAKVDERVCALCRADYALSLACNGNVNQAIEQLELIGGQNEFDVPPDEAALRYHQFSLVYAAAGKTEMSELYRDKVAIQLEMHEQVQKTISGLLSSQIGLAID